MAKKTVVKKTGRKWTDKQKLEAALRRNKKLADEVGRLRGNVAHLKQTIALRINAIDDYREEIRQNKHDIARAEEKGVELQNTVLNRDDTIEGLKDEKQELREDIRVEKMVTDRLESVIVTIAAT